MNSLDLLGDKDEMGKKISNARYDLQKGITFVELLMVVTIISVIGVVVAPFSSSFIGNNNLEVTTDQVISSIRKAQGYAMDGKDDSTWGVCLTGGDIRLFSGTCASPTISEDFTVPASISVSGLTETTFSKMRGEPSSTMSITVSSDTDSVSIDVNTAGGIDIN